MRHARHQPLNLVARWILGILLAKSTASSRHCAWLSARPFTDAATRDFIATSMGLRLTVVSGGLDCFAVAASMGAVHDSEVTGGGKPSVLNDKFRAGNTLIGNIKTALTGMHHAIQFAKYDCRYIAEVKFSFNWRYNMGAMLGNLLRAMTKTPGSPNGESRLLGCIANQSALNNPRTLAVASFPGDCRWCELQD